MGEVKQKQTYYFYNGMIDIKYFDPILLKIDRKSYKNISIYNIGYIAIKKIDDYENSTVWILCIYLLIMRVDISKKKGWINT